MKITAFSVRDEEAIHFRRLAAETGWTITVYEQPLSRETIPLLQGCENVSILGGTVSYDRALLKELREAGVRNLVARSIGWDYIDVAAAGELGLRVSNISYSPFSVAEYALMLILLCQRHMGSILARLSRRDYTIDGTAGTELWACTVGVVGAGRIGRTLIQLLQGFGCKILAYDPFPPKKPLPGVTFTEFETLLRESDVISVHIPSTPENEGLFCRETFGKMKDGVVFVNTARGDLVVTEDLLEALHSGKIGAAGLDVLREEEGLFRVDHGGVADADPRIRELEHMENVFLTPHIAFHTDQAVAQVVENTIESFRLFASGAENPWELTKKGTVAP